MKGERLQKVMAHAGVGSRRACEKLILEGRVTVAGQVVQTVGTTCDPLEDEIKVDGEVLKAPKLVYFALNKPRGVVTTSSDELLRPTVFDLVQRVGARLFAVGRLDRSTEGLLLLTNDGHFGQLLSHPRFQVEKSYVVRVRGQFTKSAREAVDRGVWISDGKCEGMEVRRVVLGKHDSILSIVLREGKNRELRRVLSKLGYPVLSLRRTAVGSVCLGELRVGQYRPLRPDEVESLMEAANSVVSGDGSVESRPEKPSRRKRARGWAKAKPKTRSGTPKSKKKAAAKKKVGATRRGEGTGRSGAREKGNPGKKRGPQN